MAGSPKKPAELRQGRGGTRDLAVRDTETVVPLPPRGLLKRSRQRWVAYWESPVAKAADPVVDLHRAERWIRAVDEYDRVYPVFVKQRVTEGSTKQATLNPLGGYLRQIDAEIGKAEAELGLTPMSRLRLGIMYGTARITAAELNKALNEGDDGSSDTDAELAAEWAEA